MRVEQHFVWSTYPRATDCLFKITMPETDKNETGFGDADAAVNIKNEIRVDGDIKILKTL